MNRSSRFWELYIVKHVTQHGNAVNEKSGALRSHDWPRIEKVPLSLIENLVFLRTTVHPGTFLIPLQLCLLR